MYIFAHQDRLARSNPKNKISKHLKTFDTNFPTTQNDSLQRVNAPKIFVEWIDE